MMLERLTCETQFHINFFFHVIVTCYRFSGTSAQSPEDSGVRGDAAAHSQQVLFALLRRYRQVSLLPLDPPCQRSL